MTENFTTYEIEKSHGSCRPRNQEWCAGKGQKEFIRQTRQSGVEKKNMAMSPAGSGSKEWLCWQSHLQFTQNQKLVVRAMEPETKNGCAVKASSKLLHQEKKLISHESWVNSQSWFGSQHSLLVVAVNREAVESPLLKLLPSKLVKT